MSRVPQCANLLLHYNQTKVEVWLPATTKIKLEMQVLVQKKRGFIKVPCDLGKWWTPVSKTISISLIKPEVLIEIGRGGLLFFLSNNIASFWSSRALSIHIFSFWCSQWKNLPPASLLANRETPSCSNCLQ